MIIGKIFVSVFKGANKVFGSKTGKNILKAGAVVGAGLTALGAGVAFDANKKNKQAKDIQKEALELHDGKLQETEKILASLTELKSKCIHNFKFFLKATERIEKCPQMNLNYSSIDLPAVTRNELKSINDSFELALQSAGASTISGLAGIALCGLNVGALSFASLGGGVFICVKSVNLHKQAVNNLNEAKIMKENVDKIVSYYNQLQDATNILIDSISKLNFLYVDELYKLYNLVKYNRYYETYTKIEKMLVSNCFKLTMMLVKMCRITLGKKVNDEESVNIAEINEVINDANVIYQEVC